MNGPTGPPTVVTSAAVVTWVATAATALLTLLVAGLLGPAAAAILEAFGAGTPASWAWVVGAAAVVLGLCGAAAVCAFLVLRGVGWARWLLLGLSVLTALAGLALFAFGLPLVATTAAVAVIVLLLVPDAGPWFRRDRQVSGG